MITAEEAIKITMDSITKKENTIDQEQLDDICKNIIDAASNGNYAVEYANDIVLGNQKALEKAGFSVIGRKIIWVDNYIPPR